MDIIESGFSKGAGGPSERPSRAEAPGASAPESLVQEIATFFQKQGAVLEELVLRHEDVHFALPPDLQDHFKKRESIPAS